MIKTAALAGVLCAFMYFAYRRTLRYLHIFQQEEYDGPRFIKWLVREIAIDKRLSLVILAVLIAFILIGLSGSPWIMNFLLAALFLAASLFEPDPRQTAKKKLVLTQRAKCILGVALAAVLLIALAASVCAFGWPWLVAIHAIPFTLPLAVLVLTPMERRIQRAFWQEAHDKLQAIDPNVVGVTGSFGKTSVKHILGHILDLSTNALITPGSVNTPMGITRVIRESMDADCEQFVVEMGAYGLGSIARLCALAPPDLGLITALGAAHYERFNSLDAVARTKFELAEAVIAKPDGRVIIHESVLEQPYATEFVSRHRTNFVVCGAGKDADLKIGKISTSRDGIALDIDWQGKSYQLTAPIYGVHQAGNIALAFAAAVVLDVPVEAILLSLKSLPQIKHRLEVKTLSDGSVNIDDAYNSNPIGFTAALKLLPVLKSQNGRAIIVTPGVAELGEKHDEVHLMLGTLARDYVDVALVVGSDRIESFCSGFLEGNDKGELLRFKHLSEANDWLRVNRTGDDVVLFENDLPDLYENKLSL